MSPTDDPLRIRPVRGPLDAEVVVPGSKSITNRALVCAALAEGRSHLRGALFADDTAAMVGVLDTLGVGIQADERAAAIDVVGCAGAVPAADGTLDVRQSGTTSRFLLPMLALGQGTYEVTAHPQMQRRPMQTTFEALGRLGADVEATGAHGHLPATVSAGPRRDASLEVPGDASSQFLSGLLLVAPCLRAGLRLTVVGDLVSRPYVELTIAVMEAFGATVERSGATYAVAPTGYRGCTYDVEPDASAASYPLAAAALCGGTVAVAGLGSEAHQGDAAFVDVLAAMGAEVTREPHRTTVRAERGALRGGTFDFSDISDTAQTLAVLAPFAAEPVRIGGIGFIRHKEIDRVEAVGTELRRARVSVEVDDDGWTIRPSTPGPARIETYEDHRMAMSFGLLGLAVDGIEIVDPSCVAKTFPGYWSMLESLRGGERGR